MWNYYQTNNHGAQIFRCEARARNILRYAAKFMCQSIYDLPCIHLITGERAFMTSSVHSLPSRHRVLRVFVSVSISVSVSPSPSPSPFLIHLAFSRRGFSLSFVANKIALTVEASNRAKKEPRGRTRKREMRRRSLLTGSHAFNRLFPPSCIQRTQSSPTPLPSRRRPRALPSDSLSGYPRALLISNVRR